LPDAAGTATAAAQGVGPRTGERVRGGGRCQRSGGAPRYAPPSPSMMARRGVTQGGPAGVGSPPPPPSRPPPATHTPADGRHCHGAAAARSRPAALSRRRAERAADTRPPAAPRGRRAGGTRQAPPADVPPALVGGGGRSRHRRHRRGARAAAPHVPAGPSLWRGAPRRGAGGARRGRQEDRHAKRAVRACTLPVGIVAANGSCAHSRQRLGFPRFHPRGSI